MCVKVLNIILLQPGLKWSIEKFTFQISLQLLKGINLWQQIFKGSYHVLACFCFEIECKSHFGKDINQDTSVFETINALF